MSITLWQALIGGFFVVMAAVISAYISGMHTARRVAAEIEATRKLAAKELDEERYLADAQERADIRKERKEDNTDLRDRLAKLEKSTHELAEKVDRCEEERDAAKEERDEHKQTMLRLTSELRIASAHNDKLSEIIAHQNKLLETATVKLQEIVVCPMRTSAEGSPP